MMTGTSQLTYSGIGLAVFAEQFCLPVPALLLLMTAGALAADGQGHLQLWLVILSGVVGCLLADGFWYWLGRRWGSGVIRLVCSFTSDPRASRESAHRIFDRWGLRLLLVAKFIPGLDGVSPPLAGAEGATVRRFLAYDTAGSLPWNSAYVLLGFLFAHQLDLVMEVIARFGRVALIVVGIPVLVFLLWRAVRVARMIHHLRLRRISPAMLQAKMDASPLVAVFDLANYEGRGEAEATVGIPGAVRADPKRLRTAPRLVIPAGVDVVLYCSSRNEFVSARVAEAFMKRGFNEVWVLEGGLEAWVLDGREVTEQWSTGEEVAARLGIVLPPDLR